jgi:hypothetical protein
LELSITMRIRCVHLVLLLALAAAGESLTLRRRKKDVDKTLASDASEENNFVDSQDDVRRSVKQRMTKSVGEFQDKDTSKRKRPMR